MDTCDRLKRSEENCLHFLFFSFKKIKENSHHCCNGAEKSCTHTNLTIGRKKNDTHVQRRGPVLPYQVTTHLQNNTFSLSVPK